MTRIRTAEYIELQKKTQTDINGKSVEKLDLNSGRMLAWYPSLMEAARQNNIDPGLLCNTLKHKPVRTCGKQYYRKSAGGYAWRYCE